MAEAPLTKTRTRANAAVFLGGGRITSALLAGLRLGGYRKPIVVHDRHASKLRELERQFHIEAAPDLKQALQRAGMLIIAVRPSSVTPLLREVNHVLIRTSHRPLLVVSLAAGIPLRRLRAQLSAPIRWARAMPSPVCRVARGLTALSFDRGCTYSDRTRVRRFFKHVGTVLEIPESKFDPFTATFSSSHGYHALAALAKVAQAMGLDRRTALVAASHALADGICYWRDSGQKLEDLLHEAATPGGTAAATIDTMNRTGYERVLLRGLRAGIQRARRNAKY